MAKLTENGKNVVNAYIKNLETKRKEILDAGLDTADDTNLPTIEDIEADIDDFVGSDGWYFNSWGCTDNYDADHPLGLQRGLDFTD